MEPITLLGLLIVSFGLWIEFELQAKAVIRAIANFSVRMLRKIMVVATEQQSLAHANRYVPYSNGHS